MKTIKLIFLFSILLISCTDEQTNFKQKILFEKHYTNYAWFYVNTGYLIDSLGNVRAFDLSKTKVQWNYPDSSGYISVEKMNKNLSYCNSTIGQINRDSLSHYVGKIGGASNGKISKPEMQMADFGEIIYTAYILENKTNRYKEVLIKTYGDIMIKNSSTEAEEIYGWMNRISPK